MGIEILHRPSPRETPSLAEGKAKEPQTEREVRPQGKGEEGRASRRRGAAATYANPNHLPRGIAAARR